MSVEFFTDAQLVANITNLKAIVETGRRNGSERIVQSIIESNYSYFNVRFRYHSALSLTELLPAIIVPDDTNGTWISNLPAISSIAPAAAPELPNLDFVAILTTPDRIVKWRSPIILPSTPTVSDWIPDFTAGAIATIPTFNADFVGQRVVALDTGIIYKADDQAGGWTAI